MKPRTIEDIKRDIETLTLELAVAEREQRGAGRRTGAGMDRYEELVQSLRMDKDIRKLERDRDRLAEAVMLLCEVIEASGVRYSGTVRARGLAADALSNL